jgi:putative FmdB family regulatory protein
MPIYEYRCEHCGHEMEALQKISDAPLTNCPACGHARLKKLISAAGFRLKGGGWYETDFKSSGRRNLAGDSDGASSSSSSDSSKEGSAASTTSSASTSTTTPSKPPGGSGDKAA